MKKLIILFSLLVTSLVFGRIKIGVLAPEGTTWAKNLKKMAKEIKKETNKEVQLKIYYGGVAGDEPDVLRKIRIGQLHGGIFTGRALGEINGDVRIMEVPFTFENNRTKAWSTLKELENDFNKGFSKMNFKNLGFFEIGLVYLVSKKKVVDFDQLKGIKTWAWEGDKLVSTIVKSLNLVSVPLALPDVLSSLSTGIIDAAYSSPMGILALQWNSKIKYFIDYPITYSLGAFLVSQKAWKKISEKNQVIVEKIANKYIALANEGTIKENNEAKAILKNSGVTILTDLKINHQFNQKVRKSVIKELTGKLFSDEIVKKFEKTLKKSK